MEAPADTWMYSSDGPRLFKKGEDIPAGYVDSPAKVVDEPGDGIDMTDDELRAEIEKLTGKKPHHKSGRAKLIELWEEAYTGN